MARALVTGLVVWVYVHYLLPGPGEDESVSGDYVITLAATLVVYIGSALVTRRAAPAPALRP